VAVEAEHAIGAATASLNAYLGAALDCVIMADATGRVVEFNPAAERTFGYTREEVLGRTLAELIVPPSLRDQHELAFARFVETGEARLFGHRLELTGMRADGSEFPVELALSRVESEPLLVCGALRDLSEAKRAERDIRRLADEHAALHRVATLVAEQATPSEVFVAVAQEVRRVLGAPLVEISRFEGDGSMTVLGTSGEHPFRTGSRWPLDGPTASALVLETGRPAKVEYADLAGTIAKEARDAGIVSAVGVPIVVDGALWGVMGTGATAEAPLPDDLEVRLAAFTELVATAISNMQARDDLQHLAAEQASLRRVATLVALETPPEELFAAVAEEVARFVNVPVIGIARFEADGTTTAMGSWGPIPFPTGMTLAPHPGAIADVRRTGRPAHVPSYAKLGDDVSMRLVEAGIQSGLGVPIVVGGSLWGIMLALSTAEQPMPDGLEARLAVFSELVATAISNAEARDELRRTGELYRRAITQAGAVTYLYDYATEKYTFIDDAIAELTGYAADEFTPETWGNLIQESVLLGDQAGLANDEAVRRTRSGEFRHWRADQLIRTRDGKHRWIADSSVEIIGPSGRSIGAIGILQDITERKRLVEEERRLAEQQAALRRVATLVAEGAAPEDVFAAVVREVALLLDVPIVEMVRFDGDSTATVVADWGDLPYPVGTRWTVEQPSVMATILETGRTGRIDDYSTLDGELAEMARKAGLRSAVGAPIVLDGKVWGAILPASSERILPDYTEAYLTDFTELLATAISNTQARDDLRRLADELIASRARIVAASDEARRRIERNLHDGTQQRLLALGLDLQALRASLPDGLEGPHADLTRIERELDGVLEDVQELSRGLHPPLLSQSGLRAAVKALVRRSTVPVELNLAVDQRLPESIEIGAYYVVSEALANAAKHAGASLVRVVGDVAAGHLRLMISDDGVGGAIFEAGSGLIGLVDRVEALGGRLALKSPPGGGTAISIELPIVDPAADETATPVGSGEGSE
jgi:PAS domain S-box-containing protein